MRKKTEVALLCILFKKWKGGRGVKQNLKKIIYKKKHARFTVDMTTEAV